MSLSLLDILASPCKATPMAEMILIVDDEAGVRELLGDAFVAVEFESTTKQDHSVLTEQIQEEGVARVLEFLKLKLLK